MKWEKKVGRGGGGAIFGGKIGRGKEGKRGERVGIQSGRGILK